MAPNDTPLILYATVPREGHLQPALQICRYLASCHHNLDVTLLATPPWEPAIREAGLHYAPMTGHYASLEKPAPEVMAHLNALPRPTLLALVLSHGFAKLMSSGWDSVRHALAAMAHRVGGVAELRRRGVVVVSDTGFEGTLPLLLGARNMPAGFEGCAGWIRSVGVSVVPRWWATRFHPPWGSGMPFDVTEHGVRRNLEAHAEFAAVRRELGGEERTRWVLEELYGCEKSLDSVFDKYREEGIEKEMHTLYDAITASTDVTLQMGIPSLEFPDTDAAGIPPQYKFVGSLPLKPVPNDLAYPPWFQEAIEDRAKNNKKIVLVAQGTETKNHAELVIPTITALADGHHDHVLVIAILCFRGATLDPTSFPEGELPANARVIDYFPYDGVLPHADVFVSSSGFGGLTHAVANAVPLVQTGGVIDKPDIGRRVEHAGLGVYLSDFPPTAEAVGAAVDEILSAGRGDRYRRRARELREEAAACRPLEAIGEEIMGLASR